MDFETVRLPVLISGLLMTIYLMDHIHKLFRQAYSSPLSLIPNAGILAPFSRLLWAFPHEYRGNLTLELPRLHAKYGPLIRIGPREISFYSIDMYDAVHKTGSAFVKDPRTYGEFVQGGHPALFSITDTREHSRRRRLMGQVYNRSKMDNLHDLMVENVMGFVKALQVKTSSTVDLMTACRAFEADVICKSPSPTIPFEIKSHVLTLELEAQFSFGVSVEAVQAWSAGAPQSMVAANDEKAKWMPVLVSFPGVVAALERLEHTIFQFSGWHTSYSGYMRDWTDWTDEALYRALFPEQSKQRISSPNLIQTLLKSGLHPQTALCEARENIGPGTDTTSATLAHILYALAKNPVYQAALRDELEKLGFPTDMTSLESIPKLKACVKEGIRFTGAAAAMLPRLVPEGGVWLDGKYLPGGTTITSSPIWYLHDDHAFPNPKYFNPYRWLSTDGKPIANGDRPLQDKYYIPFSKGANVCIGAHFSYYELYLSVSQLLKHFQIASDRREASMMDSAGLQVSTQGQDLFCPVKLPKRKEWVAAVPTGSLMVKFMNIKR